MKDILNGCSTWDELAEETAKKQREETREFLGAPLGKNPRVEARKAALFDSLNEEFSKRSQEREEAMKREMEEAAAAAAEKAREEVRAKYANTMPGKWNESKTETAWRAFAETLK